MKYFKLLLEYSAIIMLLAAFIIFMMGMMSLAFSGWFVFVFGR